MIGDPHAGHGVAEVSGVAGDECAIVLERRGVDDGVGELKAILTPYPDGALRKRITETDQGKALQELVKAKLVVGVLRADQNLHPAHNADQSRGRLLELDCGTRNAQREVYEDVRVEDCRGHYGKSA